jgi:uncharacterized protein YqeY
MPTPAETLRERLRTDLKAAMLERRREDAALIRTLIAAVDNAEAVAQPAGARPADSHEFASGAAEAARRVLSEADLAAVLKREIASRHEAAAQMRAGGAVAEAERLEREADSAAHYCGGSV